MNTFEYTVKIEIEASDVEDGEDFLREMLKSEPAIVEYNFNQEATTIVNHT